MLAADEPVSVEEALEEDCWREAMNAELEAIVQTGLGNFQN
jgi:hypothetical protein